MDGNKCGHSFFSSRLPDSMGDRLAGRPLHRGFATAGASFRVVDRFAIECFPRHSHLTTALLAAKFSVASYVCSFPRQKISGQPLLFSFTEPAFRPTETCQESHREIGRASCRERV